MTFLIYYQRVNTALGEKTYIHNVCVCIHTHMYKPMCVCIRTHVYIYPDIFIYPEYFQVKRLSMLFKMTHFESNPILCYFPKFLYNNKKSNRILSFSHEVFSKALQIYHIGIQYVIYCPFMK